MRRNTSFRPAARGFTLVEVLMALAITGMLLAALGAAAHSCITSYKANENMSSASAIARTVLHRITSEIRTAAAIEATSTTLSIIPPEESGMSLIYYEYANGVLTVSRTVDGLTQTHQVMSVAEGMQTFAISHTMGTDWKKRPCVSEVTIEMLIKQGACELPLTATVSPRRNQTY